MLTPRFSIAVVALLAIFAGSFTGLTQSERPSAARPREEAYRANNIGVALLEQFKYGEAADAFRRALRLDPSLNVARLNLSIALLNATDWQGALREAQAAAARMPDAPQPHYVIGLIAKAENRDADALAAFRRVLEIDPQDSGSLINAGQVLLQQRNYPEAIRSFQSAIAAEPYNITAVYNLAIALTRAGRREEGARVMQQFQQLREAGYGTTLGQNYLEQGRYAEAVASTGAEPGLVSEATPEAGFADATANFLPAAKSSVREWSPAAEPRQAGEWSEAAKRELVASLGGGATLFDADGDGRLDLFEVTPFGQRLYKNEGGRFTEISAAAGLSVEASAVGVGAVAGDYDNDGRADLFVLRHGALTLYRNEGGKFSDVTAAAAIPAYPHLALSAAFVDVDHDGDLDIFVAGCADLSKPAGGARAGFEDFAPAPNLLLRNNGNGKFTDITAAAQVAGADRRTVAVVPTDYDNRRDVDLLLVNHGAAPTLFSNRRDGTFRDVAAEVGLNAAGLFNCAAAGDVNKDGFTDFFFGNDDGGLFAISDGRGRFATAPAADAAARAAQFLDYDDDGLLDLVYLGGAGAGVLRNLGGRWANVSQRAVARNIFGDSQPAALPRQFTSGDLDGDGDTDFVTRLPAGALRVARNDGGNRNRSLRVRLEAKVSNRSAVGARIEARAGSLQQRLEVYSASPAPAPADVIFGLGRRAAVDAVRVLWPVGILQAETEIAAASGVLALTVTELDRKPSSCPFLYAWNGERFEFVTDFLGGGEMGYWQAPGVLSIPDPDEYVRIRGDQLRARDGRFELRITNELEEVVYLDRLQLLAVAHPADTEVFPNEGMTHPPRPFKLYATRDARPPRRAVDHHGCDVLARLTRVDRAYVDDFAPHRIRGYAEEHALTLDLGEPGARRTLLLLTGWTDYAFSSDNVAAHQSGLRMMPPALQVKDAAGRWQTVIANLGIPVGRPQTVTVDLTGKFPTSNREVRIVTNMRIYWDQILVDTSGGATATRTARLEPSRAELRWRGFSAESTPDGREPFAYDYDCVSPLSPWKVMPGRYTREGDVRELLTRTDDMFVITRPGDEVAVAFDATQLPPLPKGWKHTFLLYADGYSKEMDINSASPDAVAPLPFHAMKSYPYDARQSYPRTPAHRAYVERYNTRVVAAPLPRIEAAFAEKGACPPRR